MGWSGAYCFPKVSQCQRVHLTRGLTPCTTSLNKTLRFLVGNRLTQDTATTVVGTDIQNIHRFFLINDA